MLYDSKAPPESPSTVDVPRNAGVIFFRLANCGTCDGKGGRGCGKEGHPSLFLPFLYPHPPSPVRKLYKQQQEIRLAEIDLLGL